MTEYCKVLASTDRYATFDSIGCYCPRCNQYREINLKIEIRDIAIKVADQYQGKSEMLGWALQGALLEYVNKKLELKELKKK